MTTKERIPVVRKLKLRSIPVDLVMEILSWLPFKTLQRFKCVCKLWLRLLTVDSYFGKLHCKRVMIEMVRRCDYETRHTSFFGLQSDESLLQDYDHDFFEEIYQCFYGNNEIFSFQNFVRRLNASGFLQQPQYMLRYGKASFCNGLYVLVSSRIYLWFGILGLYAYGTLYYEYKSTLVLAPTTKAARDLVMSMPYDTHVCVDENSVLESQLLLLSGKKVVVGTPGCVFEILPRHSIGTDCINNLVLYKADELFARGFKEKIFDIFKLLPMKVKVVVISAWMPREALEIPQQFWNQKAGHWITDTRFEASEKSRTSSRSLWIERAARVKHEKEFVATKAMCKYARPARRAKNCNS